MVGDNSLLTLDLGHMQMVTYGEVPVYNGATPYMSGAVSNYAYTFIGWDPELAVVEGPATYTPRYNLVISHNVSFVINNASATTPAALTVAEGAAVERPADQLVGCQHIAGWYKDADLNEEWDFANDKMGDHDIILYAKWETKTYTITWLDENADEIDQTTVDCGTVPSHADLYKPSTAACSYEWRGWNKTLVAANANATYKSLGFTQVPKRYAITFVTGSGATTINPIELEVGATVTAPADPIREGYTFAGWMPAVPSTMPASDIECVAQWLLNVASVTVSGNTTYYASVADAITFANGKTDAVVTILQDDDAVESEITISAAMTIDLNGKTVSSTQTTASTGVFKISASGKTVTINGTGGTIKHTASASVYGINVAAGSTLNMTGGTVIVDGGSGNPRGIYVRGASGSTATVSLTDVEVETKSTGNNSITYAYANVTIHSGTYTATATSSSARYAAFTRDEPGSKITIEGGKFNGQDKDVHKGGTTATISISGGYYVHDTNIETYCATNHHVFPASLTEGGVTYNFEVAEAYTVTFKNGETTMQEGPVKKGTTPTYNGKTPAKEDESYTYSFTGWSPAITTVTKAATYTATFSSTPRTYTVKLNTYGGTINAGDVTEYTYGTGATLPTNVTKDGYEFGGWFDNDGLTGDAVTTISTTATGDKTYWAKWTQNIADRELDIVEWTSNSVTINVTNLKAVGGTNKNNWAIRVNDTDYPRKTTTFNADRTLTISGLSLTPNENLLIQLKDETGKVESQHNYKIPQIYSENAPLSGTDAESVVYVYGGKLTISDDITLAALYVCPGAEVEVTGTLNVGKLVLRTKPWATAAISGNVTERLLYTYRSGWLGCLSDWSILSVRSAVRV